MSTQKKKRTAPLLPKTRCTAHSKQTGEPCKNPPMNGSSTCRMHGSATKAARAKAQERIAAAADPAAAKLVELMQSKKVPHHVQLLAARDILDRAGLKSANELIVGLRKFEEDMADILVDIEFGPRGRRTRLGAAPHPAQGVAVTTWDAERVRRWCQLMILEAADDDRLWAIFDRLVAKAEAQVMAGHPHLQLVEDEAELRE